MRMSKRKVMTVSLPIREQAFTKQTHRAESFGRRGDCNDSAGSTLRSLTDRSLTGSGYAQLLPVSYSQSVTPSQLLPVSYSQSVRLPSSLRAACGVCVLSVFMSISPLFRVSRVSCVGSPCVRVLRGVRLLRCLRSAFVLRLRLLFLLRLSFVVGHQ